MYIFFLLFLLSRASSINSNNNQITNSTMGNCSSVAKALDIRQYDTRPMSQVAPSMKPSSVDAASTSSSANNEKPQPMIFALMRNGHEVIRGAMRDLQESIEKGDIQASKVLWDKLLKWSAMHMKMEEGNGTEDSPVGFFRLLDNTFDGIATKAGLFEEHHIMEEAEENVNKAFSDGDIAGVKTAFKTYEKENSAHLKKEEGIMMPKVMEMKKMGKPLKKYMKEELLATIVNTPDFEFFVKFANEILERHSEGMPRVRVFDHALWAVSTPEQWKVYDKWIKDTLSDKSYQEIQAVL